MEQRARTTHDYEVSETEHVPTASLTLSDSHDGGGGYGGGKGGFSAGSGLKTIAQGSAERANNAVANQHAAGRQAAAVAKSTLAQAAIGVSYRYSRYLILKLNTRGFGNKFNLNCYSRLIGLLLPIA